MVFTNPVKKMYKIFVTGEGEFGDVYQGIYITEAGEYKEVAVKALSKDNIQPNQVRKIFTSTIGCNLNFNCFLYTFDFYFKRIRYFLVRFGI